MKNNNSNKPNKGAYYSNKPNKGAYFAQTSKP